MCLYRVCADLQTQKISLVKHSLLPFFLQFLYHDEAGSASNPLKGWLQGPLLVKVHCQSLIDCRTNFFLAIIDDGHGFQVS